MDREPTSGAERNPIVSVDWPRIPEAVVEATRGAHRIATLTDNGQDPRFLAARRGAMALAAAAGAELVLFDVTTASITTDPYGRGDVTSNNAPIYSAGERLLGAAELGLLGRDYLVLQLEEARSAGIAAGAWLARGPNLSSLAEFVARFEPDVLVAPETLDGAPRVIGSPLEIDEVLGAAGGRPVVLADVEALRLAAEEPD